MRTDPNRAALTALVEGKPLRKGNRQLALGRLPKGQMNLTEADYASELQNQKLVGIIRDYWFEGICLNLAPRCTYTPDFLVLRADLTLDCVDVKGTKKEKKTGRKKSFSYDDSRVKLRLCADRFPFRFIIVFKVGQRWEEEIF